MNVSEKLNLFGDYLFHVAKFLNASLTNASEFIKLAKYLYVMFEYFFFQFDLFSKRLLEDPECKNKKIDADGHKNIAGDLWNTLLEFLDCAHHLFLIF